MEEKDIDTLSMYEKERERKNRLRYLKQVYQPTRVMVTGCHRCEYYVNCI